MRKKSSPSRADPASENDALEQALRALRHRERSATEVDRFLAARGVDDAERGEVLETLERTALVDDRRFADVRASALAERGAGDELIRHELARAGVAPDLVDGAIATLPRELVRAERVVERRGSGPKTARYLAGKGFAEDVVLAVVAHARDEPLG
jgi:SOS response regulatory protein OraA/RecX